MSLLNIGRTALTAANLGMATTSHNIANANTPGYSRQQITQRAAIEGTPGLFGGKGVEVVGIERITNEFFTQQANIATADASRSNIQLTYLNRIADLLTGDEASIPGSVNRFFSGLQDLASRPASQTERQTVLARANSLADRFNNIDGQLQGMTNELARQLDTSVAKINSSASRIAALNDQIALQMGNGITPNDLLDQRDQLVRELSSEVKVSPLEQPDGRIDIFLASGDPLVMRNGASKLVVQSDVYNPGTLQLASTGTATGGNLRPILTNVDLGGKVSGLMSLQADINGARNEIGRIAITMATEINNQQQLGQDLNGQAGTALFAVATPKAFSVNGGAGSISAAITDSRALKASDYRVDYDGTNYLVTRQSDGVQTTYSSLPQTVDGLTISAGSTAPVSGQTFLIQPVREGASFISTLFSDTSRLAAALPVNASLNTANTGTAQVQQLSVNGPPPRAATILQPVAITFTSATAFSYTVNGGAAQTGTLTADNEIVVNGWTLKLNGTPATGDQISVTANTNGSGDNRNLIAMGKLSQTQFIDGDSITEANGELIGSFGNRAAEMAITAKANDRLLEQVRQQESSVSGVNLDEEAANLMRYQQAYQAAAKAMAAANQVFEAILSLAG